MLCSNVTFSQVYLDYVLKSNNVNGGVIIENKNGGYFVQSDEFEARRQTPPAATYLLMAYLLVAENYPNYIDENKLGWDGVNRMFFEDEKPEWQCSQNLKEAFKCNNDYFFQFFLSKLSINDIQKKNEAVGYVDKILLDKLPYFWQFGGFTLSAVEQVTFVRKLDALELPFSKSNQIQLKNSLFISEENDKKIYGTTAYTIYNKERVLWFVGWLESFGDTYYFSCRLYHPIDSDLEMPNKEKIYKVVSDIFLNLSLS